jgi:hypothetical protein
VSRNRPGVAQRVPGGLGSQISWHSARESGKVVSLTHRPPLSPGMFLVLIFTRDWVDPRTMVRSEGNMSLKNPVTPRGNDPGTVRLVWVLQHSLHYESLFHSLVVYLLIDTKMVLERLAIPLIYTPFLFDPACLLFTQRLKEMQVAQKYTCYRVLT